MNDQLALPGYEELAAAEEGISYEEAQRISVAAWEAFEELLADPERPEARALKEPFEALIAQGWGWRKALYIAWARLPIQARWPRTQQDLAEVMGLRSARTIRKWRSQNPGIDLLVSQSVAGRISERTADVLAKVYDVAISEGYKGFNDRKLWLEIEGIYRSRQDIALSASPVNADEMARRQEQAAREAEDWEAERWGAPGGVTDEGVERMLEVGEEDEDDVADSV